MECVLSGASLKTDEEEKAHENTTRHLIAARNMWRRFIEHPDHHHNTFTETLKSAHASLADIEQRLALLSKKEG
jgi:hypothetical protein